MRLHRLTAPLLAALALSAPALASYHYVHYASRNAPFTPIYEKFNLAALPSNTVTFFVADQGPAIFAPNDSFGSVLGQIRQAAAAWNSIPSSNLRVAFGGLESYTPNPTPLAPGSPTLAATTPGADVIFVDLPGVLGLGAPTTSTVAVDAPDGSRFFPIVRGLVMLSRDTTQAAGPSYLESYFTTAVHEIGHALGLQHTWTGSAMSQGVIRNTSRARPIDADDIAAISVLYGKPGWQANFGSISGRVTYTNNTPAALASVVAIAATGPAVSTLTDPDGYYRIDGLPPNYNYSVYVHPLPPGSTDSTNLRLPVDASSQAFIPSGAFQTVFYPGTLDPGMAAGISVNGGAPVTGINFSVSPRSSAPTYDVETFAFMDSATRTLINTGNVLLQPAYINSNQIWGLVVARAKAPAFLPAPLSMTIMGGIAPALLRNPFANQPTILDYEPGTVAAYFSTLGAASGPRHLVFNFGNDIYVLPGGVTVVRKGPPVVNSVLPNPDGSVTITGAGLGGDSMIYFDGVPAVSQGAVTGTDDSGSVTVIPPEGASGQISTITVYNSDGQNSMLLQSGAPPTYLYPAKPAAVITGVSATSMPATSSAYIDITASNTNFVDGGVTVGFGSSDVAVRQIWIMSPTRVIADVTVAPGAAIGPSQISVISGLAIIPQAGTFQTQPAWPGFPFLALPILNADPAQSAIYAGSTAVISGQNLAVGPSGPQITLNSTPVQITSATPAQIMFVVPAPFPAGPAVLQLHNGVQNAFPVLVQIDVAPPVISTINNESGAPVAGIAIPPGSLLNILVTGVKANDGRRVRAQAAGVNMPIQQLIALPDGLSQVQAVLTRGFGGAPVPLTISLDGSASAPFPIVVR